MSGKMWRAYSKANNVIRFFTGPAQIGAGHPEGPDIRSAEAACPLCGKPMSAHRIERSTDQLTATRMHCP
jgi:hypothetical protein